jgi:Domain of unknown function (DUF4145)
MKCPYCTVSIHEAWELGNLTCRNKFSGWQTKVMQCPACQTHIIQVGLGAFMGNQYEQPDEWHQVIPKSSSRGPVSPDVPPAIADDYRQAALVLADSPKASAALSRRCLQAVLTGAGYSQKDLAKQIDAVLSETDSRKAVPSGLHSILDAIRNFGNFSAHPITDQTTLQVIDVEDHEAEYCLDILDAAFDHYYISPAEAARKKAALNAKLAAAKKPPSK